VLQRLAVLLAKEEARLGSIIEGRRAFMGLNGNAGLSAYRQLAVGDALRKETS
jgi:hypothetical protein